MCHATPNKQFVEMLVQTIFYLYPLIQEGGELYFSDMYASKVVPQHMKHDAVLWGKITLHHHLKSSLKTTHTL